MRKIALLALLLLMMISVLSSCAGMKITTKEAADQAASKPKPGLTLNGGFLSGGGLEKGYWCDVRGTILTFGSSGPTEAKATELARVQCHKVYPDNPCELVSCKPN